MQTLILHSLWGFQGDCRRRSASHATAASKVWRRTSTIQPWQALIPAR